MLGAQKNQLIAHLQVRGLDLRKAELDFYMSRFTMSGGLASIMTCLSYVGIIKIRIPHEMLPPNFAWQVALFYISTCITMSLSMYNLVVTSFCVVYAQGLALRGPPGSVAKSVRIFQNEWRSIRLVLILSMVMLVVSGCTISWMKLDRELYHYPLPAVIITIVIVTVLFFMVRRILLLQRLFAIPSDVIVRGDLTIEGGTNERIDLVSANAASEESPRSHSCSASRTPKDLP
uniref:Uncharacterized protein n=1 Tax=Chrysotila carterae TaxID=13221 RepID=A0A7S4BGT7_CHRCT|mmetsp:Transcript_13958/g.29444  ORF Transcript_13958/g.29444 Transcript_13958/m.29444 type:complete len:232 (+) Transcript_13958:1374-2069(+)